VSESLYDGFAEASAGEVKVDELLIELNQPSNQIEHLNLVIDILGPLVLVVRLEVAIALVLDYTVPT